MNLRGYDPGQPVPAADALAGFLRVAGRARPGHPAGRGRARRPYRSLLAGKRMLVVLDNAGSAEQVRPLLPGTAGLHGDGDQPGRAGRAGGQGRRHAAWTWTCCRCADAVALLRTLIGGAGGRRARRRRALAAQCCRLPLALRVAAELAASRPAVPLAELAAELADLQHPAGPAGRRAGTRAPQVPGRVLLVLPAPGRRRRPGLPAARPAPRPRPRAVRRRRPHRHDRAAGPPGAGRAGPRAPDPARRAWPVRHARPAPRLRPRTGRRPGRPRTSSTRR